MALAQNSKQEFSIVWDGNQLYGNSILPTGKLIFHDAQNDYLPVVEFLLDHNNIDQLGISILAWEPCSEIENKSLSTLGFSQYDIKTDIHTRTDRGIQHSYLSTIPIIADSTEDGAFLKITKFSVVFKVKAKQEVNSAPNGLRTSSINESVLAEGAWFKMATWKEGMYIIDRNRLTQMGINAASIDPRKIKIYGNGGGMLPQKNSDSRPEDLVENAIYVHGETDGRFDQGDYILFYGQDAHQHHLLESGDVYYEHNVYSDSVYYFLTVSNEYGKRIQPQESVAGTYPVIEAFDAYAIHKAELEKPTTIPSGRHWFGERFDGVLSRSFNFDFPNTLAGENGTAWVAVMAQSNQSTSFDVSLNNQNAGNISMLPISQNIYTLRGTQKIQKFDFSTTASTQQNVGLTFNRAGNPSRGFLDYLIVKVPRKLQVSGNELIFSATNSLSYGMSTYRISNATANMNIWDITDPLSPESVSISLNGNQAEFNSPGDTLRKFIAFHGQNFTAPTFAGTVSNQNLRGARVPNFLIVCHPLFLSAANRLAVHRNQHDGLDVLIVTPQQIYNEFSSGALDVSAIRDFVRHLYKKDASGKFQNVLLFGKTSFDFKGRPNTSTNFVPSYGSRNSLHPIESYSSDDYFAFLDDDEGEWIESRAGDHLMDIGIGRLPVKTPQEAENVVDKIIKYSTDPQNMGNWRNNIAFVAEDGDANIHQRDADKLATHIDTAFAWMNIKKIYIDAFPQIITGSRTIAPRVNEALNKAVEEGSLIINYTGHGSNSRWANQTILDIPSILSWKNGSMLPFFVTATCEFGQHDSPNISGAEHMVLHPYGGAIGILTAARPVYSNTNFQLNQAFVKNAFEKENGKTMDLGAIYRLTKNNSLNGPVNRNFVLLGDPSMKLLTPQSNIVIEYGEDEEIKNPGDTLQALSLVTVRGFVADEAGEIISNFNGLLSATVHDKQNRIRTLGFRSPVMSYLQWDQLLFKGDVSVHDGRFTLRFMVPKNISYQTGEGKLSMFAVANDKQSDAAGAERRFVIGGTNPEAETDNTPPEIELYINDTSFVSGGITKSEPLLLAKLFDVNGINITDAGLGQGLNASLNNGNAFSVNNYFSSEKDSYQQGWLRYPMGKLEAGRHTVQLQAWDTHLNFNTSEIEFIVVDDENIAIKNLINYPNPVYDYTYFSFEHNRSGDNLDLQIDIVSANGQLVKTIYGEINNSPGRIEDLEWDARNNSGAKLDAGIYIFRLYLRSLTDGAKMIVNKKLVIIN